MSVHRHYDTHLAPVYSWMLGGLGPAAERAAELFRSLRLNPVDGAGSAIDLGCGPGTQSLPLARLGYRVLAIDTCQPLLDELAAAADGLRVRTLNADLLAFDEHAEGPADVITCMGDTITHLPSLDKVAELARKIGRALKPGGVCIITYRDLAARTLEGTDRFVPVRADDDRILTCFLEYRAEKVAVHDILHTREPDGWRMRVSVYEKLRIPAEWLTGQLREAGLAIDHHSIDRGMATVVAMRK